jgi:hypothetical protein
MSVHIQIRQIMRDAARQAPRRCVRDARYIAPGSDLYRAIVADLQAGTSYYRAAGNAQVATNTARRVARLEGLERHDPKVLAGGRARSTFSRERRIALLDRAFERLELLLPEVETAKELQQFAAALGVLIDRRRLEDDEVTSREETVDHSNTRPTPAPKVERLAARRMNGHQG